MATNFQECHPPFSVTQLAKHWGCGESIIRKLIADGALKSFRIGVLIRISATEVERFECHQQQTTINIPSSDSEEGSPSSGGKKPEKSESDTGTSSNRKIARARRRKPEKSGPNRTIVRGPWAGS